MPRQITSRKPKKEFLLPRKRIVVRECSETCAKGWVVHLLALCHSDPVLYMFTGDVSGSLNMAVLHRIVPYET